MLSACCFIGLDTFKDFSFKRDSLPLFKNVDEISKALKLLAKHAAQKNIPVFSSVEIDENEEKLEINGKRKISPSLGEKVFIDLKDSQISHKKFLQEHTQIVLKKKDFDIFSNPHTLKFLRKGHFEHCVVYGFGLDYGFSLAISRLIEEGFKVWVPVDGAVCIHEDNREKALIELRKYGANMVNVDFILQNT